MPSLDERVAHLEGRFQDHMKAVDDLRTGLADVRTDLRNGLADVRHEMVALREQTDRRFDAAREEVNRRLETLDRKIDHHFTWLVGIQVASLVAVVGALVGSYFK